MKTKINVPLLRRIIRLWKEEPKRLDMDFYLAKYSRGPSCKTVGCIAGWAAVVDRLGKQKDPQKIKETAATVKTRGREHEDGARALGLNPFQAGRLFFTSRWPEHLDRSYQAAKTAAQRVAVTVKRINLFIKTKGKK